MQRGSVNLVHWLKEFLSLQGENASHHWFPNITDLTVMFGHLSSLESFWSVIDLAKVTKLSLDFNWRLLSAVKVWNDTIYLLGQTPNIRSLTVDWIFWPEKDLSDSHDLVSTIIRYVDPSKLRHLVIPIRHVDEAIILLETFTELISVNFSFSEQIFVQQLTSHLSTLWYGCGITRGSRLLIIWLGERRNTTVGGQRSDLSCREGRLIRRWFQ